ncbi:MAG: hypothetical protein KatS3mg060_1857 [Dehalococcoidia bacterium]|jgi:hypothetical protein|nr:MAG: hypothetical protein KatS3mg060_1857 [Dehalococcoidia bacterium]
MGLPVAIAGYRAIADRSAGCLLPARPLAPAYRVEPILASAPIVDTASAASWGPAAQLALTPLGDAVLRAYRPGVTVSTARLDLVRRMIAAEGCTPEAIGRAAQLLTEE